MIAFIILLFLLANDNRYEGEWRDGNKHGHGKFFYVTRGQLMEGLWVDNICKAGQMKDFGRDQAILPTPYPIPDVSSIFLSSCFVHEYSFFFLVIIGTA